MIYADPSFLASLYGWDANTQTAQDTFADDARRPLLFTPWQRLELRNAIRLGVFKHRRAKLAVPYQVGMVFKHLTEDLEARRLKHAEQDWLETFRIAETLSAAHTEDLGVSTSDLWHVAAAAVLGADTFWTFDDLQAELARRCRRFDQVPKLPTA